MTANPASSREAVRALWSDGKRLDYLLVRGYPFDPGLLATFPEELCLRYGVLPIVQLPGRAPVALAARPLSLQDLSEFAARGIARLDVLPSAEPLPDLVREAFDTVRARNRRPIGIADVLARDGLIPADLVEQATREAAAQSQGVAEYLVREGYIDDAVAMTLAAQLAGLYFIAASDVARLDVRADVVKLAKPDFARQLRAMPVSMQGEVLVAVTIDPTREFSSVRMLTKARQLRTMVVPVEAFNRIFREAHGQPFVPQKKAGAASTRNPRFRAAVIAKGWLGPDAYARALEAHGGSDLGVLEYLTDELKLSRETVGTAWGDSLGVACLDLERTLIQSDVVGLVPEAFSRQHQVLAVYQFADVITAATPFPTPVLASELGKILAPRKVEVVFALPGQVKTAIELHYQSEKVLQDLARKVAILEVPTREGTIDLEQLQAVAGSEAVISFAEGLLLFGVKERASDIHIEPCEDKTRVRFRIDGRLQERFSLARAIHPMLTSRLKILAKVDITERRIPQDGRLSVKLGDQAIDFRFSSTPTIYGEKIVLRALSQIQRQPIAELKDLAFSKQNHGRMLRILGKPNGIFFVTGPTGSGKSMTLYSCLKHLNDPDTNIVTAEDPVEYRLAGINQVQVNHDIGFDFQKALRSFLRQDPDVILVGEIRDKETAKIASEAALTGHLVLATLHTNSALQAFTRLVEIGVEPYLVAPAVVGAMGQRLVRRICEGCKFERDMTDDEFERLFDGADMRRPKVYQGAGCARCRNTGYFGRLAIHEVLEIDEALRGLIARNAPITDMQSAAYARGFRSMHWDGLKKALRGMTSLSEVEEVATAD
jgi:type IV pilus assembly protein PilB